MKITVVIPHYNEPHNLSRTIRSLMDNADEPGDVYLIIVDDDSDECVVNDSATVIYNRSRVGPAVCRHRGIMASTTSLIVTCDAHMEFASGWDDLIKQNMKDGRLFSGRYRSVDGSDVIENDGSLLHLLRKDSDGYELLQCDPVPKHGPTDLTIRQVMIPIGGLYALIKEDYIKLGSPLKLFTGWGMEEPVLAMAYWCTGGDVVMLNSVIASHLQQVVTIGRTPRWKLLACKLAALHLILNDSGDTNRVLGLLSKDPDYYRASSTIDRNSVDSVRALMNAKHIASCDAICERFGVETLAECLNCL